MQPNKVAVSKTVCFCLIYELKRWSDMKCVRSSMHGRSLWMIISARSSQRYHLWEIIWAELIWECRWDHPIFSAQMISHKWYRWDDLCGLSSMDDIAWIIQALCIDDLAHIISPKWLHEWLSPIHSGHVRSLRFQWCPVKACIH